MSARDIVFLIGLMCLSVGSRLKTRVDAPWAWESGDILESIAPYLMGAKALPQRQRKNQKPTV